MPFLAIPLYISALGSEQWGLLAVCLTVYAIFGVLDAGMSQVLPREVALRSLAPNDKKPLAEIFLGFERIYWIMAVTAALTIYVSANKIASDWLNLGNLGRDQAVLTIQIVGLQFLAQFPAACYVGILNGTQSQVLLNKIQITFVTLKHISAVAIVSLILPTTLGYQIGIVVITALETLTLGFVAWRTVGCKRSHTKWNADEMRKVAGFALGLAATVVVGTITVQLDKIFLSGLVSVKDFGYYAIASQVSLMMLQVTYPITRATYPYLTENIGTTRLTKPINTQFLASLAFVTVPIALSFLLFPKELLSIWLHDQEIANAAAPVLSLLVLGTLANAIYCVPYLNWLAAGKSNYPFFINIGALLLGLLLLKPSIEKFGINGAAISWLLVNGLGLLFGYASMARHNAIDLRDTAKIVSLFGVSISVFLVALYYEPAAKERIVLITLGMVLTVWVVAISRTKTKALLG